MQGRRTIRRRIVEAAFTGGKYRETCVFHTVSTLLWYHGARRCKNGCFYKLYASLLSNAVSYTKPGHNNSVVLNARQIKIENECTPIPPDKLAHVFEPFYRPDFARDRKDGGNVLYPFPILRFLSLVEGFFIL